MRTSAFADSYNLGDLATQAAAAASKSGQVYTPYSEPGMNSIVTPEGLLRGNSGSSGVQAVGSGVSSGPNPAGSISVPLNYEALLQADPNYINAVALYNQSKGNASSARQAALRALVEQYGGLPPGFTDSYGDLTSTDLSTAAANPYSITAQIARQYDLNKTNLQRSLAARGALESGDLGYGVGQLDTQRGQDEYNSGVQFANAFNNAISSYLGAVNTAQGNENNAIGQAYQDIISNPLYQSGSGTASLVPDWQTKYGKPVYQGPDGSLYTVDANGDPIPYGG